MKGQCALITGSTAGLGAAVAENVATLVAFLCGDAARDVTGATLPMDGGWSAS